MLICVYIRRTKCFYCVAVNFVLLGRPIAIFMSYFLAFVFILLSSDFNVMDMLVAQSPFVICK